MSSFLKEFWTFLRVRKKLWLLPVLIVMLVMGALLLLAESSAIAPFIYTLF
jgi:competence protein ComGC